MANFNHRVSFLENSIISSVLEHLLGTLDIREIKREINTRNQKIKHFACERDFFGREITRIQHISSHSISLKSFENPRIKHFSSHLSSRRMLQTQV